MRVRPWLPCVALVVAALSSIAPAQAPGTAGETPEARDRRMAWWREARFGMFIHWGLYAIPAGEWQGRVIPGAGEWIMNSARIRPADYEPLRNSFNPTELDPKRWVQIAKDAGMSYIVITSKHHDGFCLWDTKETDWDVMSTPYGRDILKQLAEACREAGIRLCFYHSIMDWTHPDYLPRRAWDERPSDDADFDRYRAYMTRQLAELLSGEYGDIGVLWFDGEWESTWTHEFGVDLDDHVRALKPDLIVNNRVDVGREGMAGHTRAGAYRGDFGTPEQEIPATGLRSADGTPLDWETCMTMNGSWGFHRHDGNWKSAETLVRMLCDIASKGGNFLLNVGPTAAGEIPPESVERLEAIGRWMRVNGEAIRGTTASRFESLPWGRSTTRRMGGGQRLYAIVFDWPKDGTLTLPGLLDDPTGITLLGSNAAPRAIRRGGDLDISLPSSPPDPIASVVAIDFAVEPRVLPPIRLRPERSIFVDAVQVWPGKLPEGVVVRYTLDETAPTPESPVLAAIAMRETGTVTARAFVGDEPFGEIIVRRFEKVAPWPVWIRDRDDFEVNLRREIVVGHFTQVSEVEAGSSGSWERVVGDPFALPDSPTDRFGMLWKGYLFAPTTGLYTFRLGSDDGSALRIDQRVVIENDGLHTYRTEEATIPLARGTHLFELVYFERDGDQALTVEWSTDGMPMRPIGALDFLPNLPRR